MQYAFEDLVESDMGWSESRLLFKWVNKYSIQRNIYLHVSVLRVETFAGKQQVYKHSLTILIKLLPSYIEIFW